MQSTRNRQQRRSPEADDGPLWLTIVQFLALNAALVALLYFGGQFALGYFRFSPLEQPVAAAGREADAPAAYVVEGTVANEAAAGVGPVYAGKVRSLAVKRGDRVKKGQLLFRMDPAPIQERIRRARQGKERTGAGVTRAYADRDRALKPLKAEVARLEAAAQRERQSRRSGPQRLERLKAQHAAASARLAAAEQKWHQVVVEAIHAHRDAEEGVEPLRALLKQQHRYSPIDGVVTSVVAGEGDWVPAEQPVVRVDDPRGYRVVALVKDDLAESLKTGLTLPIEWEGGRAQAELVELQPGWGHELFHSWIVLKPESVDGFKPRQAVQVTLPSRLAASP
jgi:multidrug efflux pump subunit AcrA (membrane-fusion protein)